MLVSGVHWDKLADVVVVGCGGAGAVAGLTARDAGAEVVVIEKQPVDRHYTNTSMSGAGFICPTDVHSAIRYGEALWHVSGELCMADRDIIKVWAEYTAENKRWIESLGGKVRFAGITSHRQLPGWECIEHYHVRGSGIGFQKFLSSELSKRKVEVCYKTKAKKLLTDSTGQVVGVRAEVSTDEGVVKELNIGASKAVIMTCGGFEFNEEMKLHYLRVYPTYFYGSPANTGDGISMTMEIGASLWHMNCCSARLVAKFPDFPLAFTMDFGGKNWVLRQATQQEINETCGYVLVDRDGKRFTREDFKVQLVYYELVLFDSQRFIYPRVPCYWIFDHKRMEAGPLPMRFSGPAGPSRLYTWSRDNKVELERGWIIQAESIRELARKLDLPVDNLHQTIEGFNICCDQGEDPEFRRRPSSLVALRNPPYYGVKLWPGGPNTQGGPRHNRKAQILNVDGNPIPKLYAAGELGSMYGMLYTSGGNIAECIAFGRIAGENAVKEPRL